MRQETGTNRNIITVSALNRQAKQLLESEFPILYVEGEISNFMAARSGHWYFTLKDDKAQVRCAMFRNRNHLVRFSPRDGQQVVVRGRISLYENRGEYQMIAEFLEDSGDGALRRAYEALKESLQREGLFDESRKRPIPAVPQHIAIITSPRGAAIHDVMTVMRRRFPAARLSILPVQVQGDESVPQIVNAIDLANRETDRKFDLILLTRGGGSLEDLWSFNTEPVARAVAGSQLPVVCAVGHESDVSIADFVADLRAPTPSAAAEMITPDARVWLDSFQYAERKLVQLFRQQLLGYKRDVTHLSRRLRHPSRYLNELGQRLDDMERRQLSAIRSHLQNLSGRLGRLKLVNPASELARRQSQLEYLQEKLERATKAHQSNRTHRLEQLVTRLNAVNPLSTLERGYAIVSTEPGDHVITNATELKPGDSIRARLETGELTAEVTSVKS